MSDRDEGLRISRLIGGSLLLLVGALLATRNVGVLPGSNLGDYWPLILVWVGATRLLGPKRAEHVASGAVVLALGIFFQLDRFGWIDVSLGDLWPVFLILAGIAMILEAARGKRAGGAAPRPEAGEAGGRS